MKHKRALINLLGEIPVFIAQFLIGFVVFLFIIFVLPPLVIMEALAGTAHDQ